jgi:hypothetical protein
VVTLPPGLGGKPVWALPGALPGPDRAAPAPTRPAPDRAVPSDVASKVLSGTVNKRDQELGIDLPAAGVVAGVLADAVRVANTTPEARATFEVRLGRQGEVLGLRVKSFSAGDAATWDRAAKSASSALAARALAVNGEKDGVTLIVKVEATQRYPAGSKERIDVKPVCANEVIEEIGDMLEDPALGVPRRDMDADERKRRFCIPVGIGGKGDVSNLGAHLQTVVRSSYKVVRAGDTNLPSAGVQPLNDRAPWLSSRADREERPAGPPRKKKKKNDKKK